MCHVFIVIQLSKVDNLDSGKPLQRNYMEKFMTKAQRKRETQPADDRFISSNYNRHKILNDIEPFTEDILQGTLLSLQSP